MGPNTLEMPVVWMPMPKEFPAFQCEETGPFKVVQGCFNWMMKQVFAYKMNGNHQRSTEKNL